MYNTLKFLNKLISFTKKMSKKEFKDREEKLGLDKIIYNPENYKKEIG